LVKSSGSFERSNPGVECRVWRHCHSVDVLASAVNGFAYHRDYALYRYNNSKQYVQAVNDYAAVLAADPAAFAGYHRWDV
jgi:hypothetical protein